MKILLQLTFCRVDELQDSNNKCNCKNKHHRILSRCENESRNEKLREFIPKMNPQKTLDMDEVTFFLLMKQKR